MMLNGAMSDIGLCVGVIIRITTCAYLRQLLSSSLVQNLFSSALFVLRILHNAQLRFRRPEKLNFHPILQTRLIQRRIGRQARFFALVKQFLE